MFVNTLLLLLVHYSRCDTTPSQANKIIEINKIIKEPKDNRIANDGGVGSTDLLGILLLICLSIMNN